MTTPTISAAPRRRVSVGDVLFWVAIAFFTVNVVGLVATVVVNSFATSWFGGSWLPQGYTDRWYRFAADEFKLADLMGVTVFVALAVVVLASLIGVPAAYVLARRNFPGKGLLMAAYLIPLLVPPITYGIPLATMLYRYELAQTLPGVILANLVPAVPFVILVMTPFIEQIDPNLESAARMLGASRAAVFARVLAPLVAPGLLTAGLLVLVRTVAMFELTFLVAGPKSQTLVVALYYSAFAAGIRPPQAIDAMAVIYMLTTLVLLVLALRWVSPTQMVFRLKE